MKMKRSKNEAIKSTIGSYLKRRHYLDTETLRSTEMQLIQTHQQMAVLASIEKETTNRNTFIYSSTSYDMSQVEVQFASFQTWISEQSLPISQELTQLLGPIMCHVYLDMFLCCPRPTTLKFLNRYQSLLMCSDYDRELYEGLSNAQLNDDAEVSAVVAEFRSSKYCVKLSQASFIMLQKYLVVHGHMTLLQVLNMYFNIEVDSRTKVEEDQGSIERSEVKQIKVEPPDEGDDDKELIRLREAIRLVREEPAPVPKLLLYTVMNNTCNVYCACRVEGDATAVGWDNEVRLFGPKTSNLTPTTNPVSRIRLSCPGTSDPDMPGTSREQEVPVTWSTLRGHSGAVQDITTVGDLTLTVSRDKTMRAWTSETGCCVAVYRAHNFPIWSVTSGPLGLVATGSRDRTARLWMLDRTFPIRIFAGHSQDVECVRFHPNGQYLATGSTDRTVRLWSVTDAKMVRVFAGAWGGIQCVAFSPDGRLLAAAGEDKRVRIWDLAAGSVLGECKGHTDAVQDLAWTSDSEQLASCSLDGSVRLWDARKASTGTSLSVFQTGNLSLLRVYFSPGHMLSCVGTEKYVHRTCA